MGNNTVVVPKQHMNNTGAKIDQRRGCRAARPFFHFMKFLEKKCYQIIGWRPCLWEILDL